MPCPTNRRHRKLQSQPAFFSSNRKCLGRAREPDFPGAHVQASKPWLENKAEAEISGGYLGRHQILSGKSVVARAKTAMKKAAPLSNFMGRMLGTEMASFTHLVLLLSVTIGGCGNHPSPAGLERSWEPESVGIA